MFRSFLDYETGSFECYFNTKIGLDYSNPYISPCLEFQRFKTHLYIKRILEGGYHVGYGSSALNESGVQVIYLLFIK